jgi:uncharacterized protein
VQWSGTGIQGRKRLQKVVFLLQAAGCPLGADYSLHHYGPYSRDVADTCDELTASGLLAESWGGNGVGVEYSYKLGDRGPEAIALTEHHLGTGVQKWTTFEVLAKDLLVRDMWELELGSTIAYFYGRSQDKDWDKALKDACEFKKKNPADPASQRALTLAKRVVK